MKATTGRGGWVRIGVPGRIKMSDLETENDLVIATSASRVLLRIKPDGTLSYGPGYTPDEAAAVFWQALARRRAEADKEAQLRDAFWRHTEKLLVEAGEADLANQVAHERVTRLATASTAADRADRVQANLEAARTNEALNMAATRLVELGRRLALRGSSDPVSDDPNPTAIN
jgi:hypothetical protein